MVSPPAVANAITSAPAAVGLQNEGCIVGAVDGNIDRPDNGPAAGLDHRGSVANHGLAQRIIGGDEVPFLAAVTGRDSRRSCAKRPRYRKSTGSYWGSSISRSDRTRPRWRQSTPPWYPRTTSFTARPTAEFGTSAIASTLILIDPSARDAGPDVRLVLVIGRDDLHLEIGVLLHEVFGGHLRSRDRSLASIVGIRPGSIVEHADLDGPRLGECRADDKQMARAKFPAGRDRLFKFLPRIID